MAPDRVEHFFFSIFLFLNTAGPLVSWFGKRSNEARKTYKLEKIVKDILLLIIVEAIFQFYFFLSCIYTIHYFRNS